MKNTIIIILAIVAVIVVTIFVFKTSATKKPVAPNLVVSPIQQPTTVPITPSKYSAELKAKVRSEFINTCHTKGNYSVSVCTCGADYLSANYSEADLAKMYLEYHTSNIVPKALEIAADKCSK